MLAKGWYLTRGMSWSQFALVSAFALSVAVHSALTVSPVTAQGWGPSPAIEITGEIIVASSAVTPLEIKIRPSGNLGQQAILMIRGLPPRVALSEGRSFGPGVWAVPLGSVANLELAPAQGATGRSEITFELVALDGTVLANAASTLYILPPGVTRDKAQVSNGKSKSNSIALTAGQFPAKPDVGTTQSPANIGPIPSLLSPDQVESARTMLSKGDDYMKAGKIAAARLFYKSAADSGYAPAALALGATYDSRQLAQWQVVGGQQADPTQARRWYEKAKELGSAEADRRLQQLGGD
jgi:hypothetical protein